MSFAPGSGRVSINTYLHATRPLQLLIGCKELSSGTGTRTRTPGTFHIFWRFQYLLRHIINTLTDSDASLITNSPEKYMYVGIKIMNGNTVLLPARNATHYKVRALIWYDTLWFVTVADFLSGTVNASCQCIDMGATPRREYGCRLLGSVRVRWARRSAFCEAANPMGISTRLIFTYPHFALYCG